MTDPTFYTLVCPNGHVFETYDPNSKACRQCLYEKRRAVKAQRK